MTRAKVSKALVTGASGFIGTRLVGKLVASGVKVLAIDILPPRVARKPVEYQIVDVSQRIPPSVGEGVDVIYNLAAVHRTPGHQLHEYYDTNVFGALNVTAMAETCGIERIVFTSSISVYGPSEDLITEDSTLQPISAYGRSKRMAELVHEQWQDRGDGRRLVTVRPGVVFGPGERGNYTNLARALRKGYFVYPGRKDAIKSGGYVDELLRTFDFVLACKDPRILYNFAYPDPSTTEDIVTAFSNIAGVGGSRATIPTGPMLLAASAFELANALGAKNPIHRERVLKLVQSTRIAPGWLAAQNYTFATDLKRALIAWRDETNGSFE